MGLSQGQGESAQDKKGQDKFSCLPVTIRVIQSAIAESSDGGDLKIFGDEPSMLVLVAAAEEVQKQNTSVELTLNDGTGRFKARYFLTDPGVQKVLDAIEPGTYVSVFGNVRTAPTNHFAALGIRPVQSADEVSYHGIEVAHAFLKLRRAKLGYDSAPAIAEKPKEARQATQAVLPSQQPSPAEAPSGKPAMSDDEMKAAILAFLSKESPSRGDQGLAFSDISKHVGTSSEEKVRACLVKIVDDGDAFNTIDDDHFSSL
eukprot:TRINITY_DN3232_c0_g2_i1.p1 TRINITY_DN3232_c0_g2~~TRINITY_DN3232_c0_g2_i1.p1  ORF type:complete len:288 (+),score=74.37 TRINITY_DN3232_c0_g2_i1:90-866(+)